jgi:hypothetical protein
MAVYGKVALRLEHMEREAVNETLIWMPVFCWEGLGALWFIMEVRVTRDIDIPMQMVGKL